MSVNQIFTFIPRGVSWGLDIDVDQVVMQSIQKYDTLDSLGYTTTLALAFIPENLVDMLRVELHTPNSRLFNNPEAPVREMMSMIDPSIPLLGGSVPSGSQPSGSPVGTDAAKGGSDGDESGGGGSGPGPGGSGSSAPVRPAAVAVGVSTVVGATIYGAAMFFVARRYRARRKLHYRSRSVGSSLNGNRTRETLFPGLFMSGGRGDGYRSTTPYATGGRNSQNSGGSARTQMISAPVMAENSLGWN
jgi:hypothetical protein